jgi:hypothetical protein
MKVLYEMINARAMQTWMSSAINRHNYDDWVKHWIGCARNIEDELCAENLPDTAFHVGKIIEEQSKYSA